MRNDAGSGASGHHNGVPLCRWARGFHIERRALSGMKHSSAPATLGTTRSEDRSVGNLPRQRMRRSPPRRGDGQRCNIGTLFQRSRIWSTPAPCTCRPSARQPAPQIEGFCIDFDIVRTRRHTLYYIIIEATTSTPHSRRLLIERNGGRRRLANPCGRWRCRGEIRTLAGIASRSIDDILFGADVWSYHRVG